ncbi:hypothetical protein MJ584_16825 [Klebsiella pneumoniae]|nr:hypothetical protein MJ584_16825 [Klebsiella pneumoniae]
MAKNSRKRRAGGGHDAATGGDGGNGTGHRLVQQPSDTRPRGLPSSSAMSRTRYNRIRASRRCWQVKNGGADPVAAGGVVWARHGVCLRSGEAVDEVDIQQRRLRIAGNLVAVDEPVSSPGSGSLSRRRRALILRYPAPCGRGNGFGDTRPRRW